MSIVYKCDRCGNIMNKGYPDFTIEGTVINNIESGWYPKKIEFCWKCAESLTSFLQEWWKNEQK